MVKRRLLVTLFAIYSTAALALSPTDLKGTPYVDFTRLEVFAHEGRENQSGEWVLIRLKFTGLSIGGEKYRGNGRAAISLDSNYLSQRFERFDLGLTAPKAAKHNATGDYSVSDLVSFMGMFETFGKVAGTSTDFNRHAAWVNSTSTISASELLRGLPADERDFISFVMLNSQVFIDQALSSGAKMSSDARKVWVKRKNSFTQRWYPGFERAFGRDFLARAADFKPVQVVEVRAEKAVATCSMSPPSVRRGKGILKTSFPKAFSIL